jgi:hypothetical protein
MAMDHSAQEFKLTPGDYIDEAVPKRPMMPQFTSIASLNDAVGVQ